MAMAIPNHLPRPWAKRRRHVPARVSGSRSPGASTSRLERHFETVVRSRHFDRMLAARDFLETLRFAPYALDGRILVGRLVMEQHEMLRVRELAQLHADDVARMPPVFLHRNRVRERIHRVEDDE